MSRNIDIYGIGNALVDTEITLTDDELKALGVEKGVMTLIDEARQTQMIDQLSNHLVASKRASGGSAANTVVGAAYLGSKTFYSCKVADDENGAFYLNDIREAGVATPSSLALSQGITGKCLVLITPDAERSMNTFLGISQDLSVDELDLAAVAQSRYVYIEGYLVSSPTGRAAAIKLRDEAKAQGTKTTLSLSDPAMVQFFRDGLLEMIGDGVDIIFCNQDEAMGFTQTQSLEAAIAALKTYARQFAITRGAQGAVIFDGEQLIEVSAPSVTAIDTNGAGDMFAGAFLHAICQGKDYKTAGEFACIAAARVVSQFGPRLQPEQYGELKSELK
ncbi:MAG: adenosine kinase [Cellvibrio sp.]